MTRAPIPTPATLITTTPARAASESVPVDDLLAATPSSMTPVIGHLDGLDDEGRVLFRSDAIGATPVPVTIGLPITDDELVRAARSQARALVFECQGSWPRRVLAGLLRDRVSEAARTAPPGEIAVEVDGATVRLNAQKEIVLRCGNASLSLRQDGRVVLSGTYVLSTSQGPNKIKGATIALN